MVASDAAPLNSDNKQSNTELLADNRAADHSAPNKSESHVDTDERPLSTSPDSSVDVIEDRLPTEYAHVVPLNIGRPAKVSNLGQSRDPKQIELATISNAPISLLGGKHAVGQTSNHIEMSETDGSKPEHRKFLIQLVTEGQSAASRSRIEIASLSLQNSVLTFEWSPDAAQTGRIQKAEQLRNCAIQVVDGAAITLVPLRTPIQHSENASFGFDPQKISVQIDSWPTADLSLSIPQPETATNPVYRTYCESKTNTVIRSDNPDAPIFTVSLTQQDSQAVVEWTCKWTFEHKQIYDAAPMSVVATRLYNDVSQELDKNDSLTKSTKDEKERQTLVDKGRKLHRTKEQLQVVRELIGSLNGQYVDVILQTRAEGAPVDIAIVRLTMLSHAN